LAGVCADACFAFNMPVALNMYLTNPGQVTSAPLHTDKQDVFVLQTQGQKHWRVYAPPSLKLNSDPFARGKDSDIFLRDEVGEPIIDTVLSPGQILYVPGGFPHTTGLYALYPLL
jgi:lysine-specific demethylase/histidyl-hydroxylase NO66